MPNSSAQFALDGFGTMNHPRSYLFIVALCLADVVIVDAIPGPALGPPPPDLEMRRTPGNVVAQVPLYRKKPTPLTGDERKRQIPQRPKEHSVWFNVGVITAIAALIAAVAQLISSLRKGR
jgi:hypothetical protein